MKKFLVMFAIAGALVACNDSGDSSTSTDSTVTSPDSMMNNMSDTSTMMGTDTTLMKDTIK
jgi:hypothetical protein